MSERSSFQFSYCEANLKSQVFAKERMSKLESGAMDGILVCFQI